LKCWDSTGFLSRLKITIFKTKKKINILIPYKPYFQPEFQPYINGPDDVSHFDGEFTRLDPRGVLPSSDENNRSMIEDTTYPGFSYDQAPTSVSRSFQDRSDPFEIVDYSNEVMN
jgi:hypothetical protein